MCPHGAGRQQQLSALRAREILFFIRFQPRSGLVPEAVGTTWGWSLGTSGSVDCSSLKAMFTSPMHLPFRGGSWEEDSSARLSSDIMLTVVSPVVGMMVSVANASPSGAVQLLRAGVCVEPCFASASGQQSRFAVAPLHGHRDTNSDCRDDRLQAAIPRAHFEF